MEQTKPVISQKEYLKRYLMKDKDKKTRKKKKQEKVSSSTHLKRSVIIDDDINISEIPRVVDDEFTLDHLGDEAPQIVGIIDERPEQVKLAEKYDSGKWRPMGAEEEKSKASGSAKRPSEDDLWGARSGRGRTRNFDDPDLSPPRAKDKSGGKGRFDDKKKFRSDEVDRWEAGDKSDSDLEVPRSQARPSQRTSSKTAQSKSRPRSDGSDSDTSVSQRKEENGGWRAGSKSSKRDQRKRRGSSSDVSPPRKNKRDQDSDISPPGRTNGGSDSDLSPPRRKAGRDSGRTPPRRSKGGSDSDLSPPRKRRGGGDSELYPPRRIKGGGGRDSSPPRRRKGGSDSDLSPPRKRKDGSYSETSSPRRKKDGGGRDSSPPRRRKGGSDSDLSPPRKRKGGGDTELSPPRRKKDGGGRDPSPPRRRKGGSDSDLSPPRRRKAGNDSDLSPPRKRKGRSNSDLSPPRREKGDRDGDRSPPRKRKGGSDSDLSPLRRKKVGKVSDRSPPRRRKGGSDSDLSPPRRKAGRGDPDLSPLRKRRNDKDRASEKQKSDQMQDGKKAGLQDAKSLKDELRLLKEKEDEMFKKMDPELLGISTQAVVRDRRTGLKRDFEKEREIERQKAAKDAVRQKKYEKWGKGLKQVREQEERVADMVHEMSKPLARYAGDDDLERALKAQEREGDPMLEYIRQHQKDSHTIDLTVGGMRKKYQGSYLPNRFNIPPGHRWDGVDRSNGYEQKWFAAKNAKKATAEEAWKWSSADM